MSSKTLSTGSTQGNNTALKTDVLRIRYVPDDADGNMTEKVSKQSGDTTFFVWDVESKLTEVRKPGMIARYTYDALGRRMSKSVNGMTTQFRYDGDDLIIVMDDNDTITASYTFGPGIDNPLVMHRDSKNYYYIKDGLGSVTALTDSTSKVVKEYQYSVFGEIIKETGLGVLNPFAYTSREYDAETGLKYYRARYYDAGIGRFLSEDPIGFRGRDENLFRYCRNNPVNFVDSYGLQPGAYYPTRNVAAINALIGINTTSIQEGREYAGWIYRLPQGGWSYTEPQAGGSDWSYPGPRPLNADAWYHTHGSACRTGKKGDEEFSREDVFDFTIPQGLNHAYLATPGRNYLHLTYPPIKVKYLLIGGN